MADEETTPQLPNCFVIMPSGRDAVEKRWFRGWYEVVIRPAVIEADYNPILSATEQQPGAINDDIRSHLAFDPMVVVDLGGAESDDDPNPNVMYELGIRHALGLPLVMIAWEGQRLPFDVSNQRAIMEPRDFLAQETNRKRLVAFIKAAAEGKYYKPMDAVGRIAMINVASHSLPQDSILGALVQEVRDLRGTIASAAFPRHPHMSSQTKPTIKRLLRAKSFRKELFPHLLALGGNPTSWSQILKTHVSDEFIRDAEKWSVDEWKAYVARRYREVQPQSSMSFAIVDAAPLLPEDLIERVRSELPSQPWPTGTHKRVREAMGISSTTYDRAVGELIRRGVFKDQRDGVVLDASPLEEPRIPT